MKNGGHVTGNLIEAELGTSAGTISKWLSVIRIFLRN